mmetsp:Transcript_8958/g.14932  ORF Transcript_8958/g.14932 Transcript_8958/m.14932 type:complete len:426 (+) Transcript_8958:179-1456(+)|eukprot:CAMPEP_0119009668 /NCGR_PEP_ID=MMETSP1176-20130426/4521_1 /TAXON_ID=265551 /ORGANISM="Synedropsis recta cf, Strain CCMP1620" /LENGTH=425 /DNA_ID=CAMNT_0006962223 /DNA_START=156 /DNA_END=1433 /DNA_ORIENTATION=-
MAASITSAESAFSMSSEDLELKDMTQSEFEAVQSNDTHTTTGETQFSAASSRSSRDGKSRSSRGSRGDDSKKSKSKKKKKKKSSKKDRKDRDDGTAESGTVESGTGTGVSESASPVYEKSDALFEKMLDAMGGEFTQSEFGDFDDADAEADFDLEDLDWDAQDNTSKKSGKSGNVSTKTPATNGTGFTRNTGFTNGAPGPSGNGKLTFENIEFADENLFDEGFNRNQPEDPFQDDDDDDGSVLSEMSGLTGVFSGVQTPVYDDEDDEGYLPEILPIQMPMHAECASSAATRRQAVHKELRFSSVDVRHYEQILTLNPSTIQGPSIGIGWRFVSQNTGPLDAYERARGPPLPSARLVLNREQREEMLIKLGYNKKQIAVGVRDNMKGRKQRRQTVQNLRAEKVEEAMEGAGKRVKRILNPFAKRKD